MAAARGDSPQPFSSRRVLLPLSQRQSVQSEVGPDNRTLKRGADDSHRVGETQTSRIFPSLSTFPILLKKSANCYVLPVYISFCFSPNPPGLLVKGGY